MPEKKKEKSASPAPDASEFKVGDRLLVKLSGGRIVEATIEVAQETTEGTRLQVSFGEETALIYLWQVLEKIR